jgi:DNA-binding transcriptional regulator GbsR (MarR family)
MRTNTLIQLTTAFLVLLVAAGSFALSYNALKEVALSNGITGRLAYLWPFLIDFALIVFSLAIVNAYLQSESTWKQWSLVGLYTVATIGFNIAHAPNDLQARIVAAIAPVSLFFSFEILMGQLKASARRSSLVKSLAELEAELDQTRSGLAAKLDQMRSTLRHRFDQERSTLAAELERLRAEVDHLTQQIEKLQHQKADLTRSTIVQHDVLNSINADRLNDKQQALNALLTFYRSNPTATLNEAGEAISRSKGTVSNYLNELEQAGLIHRNGQGVEVLQ